MTNTAAERQRRTLSFFILSLSCDSANIVASVAAKNTITGTLRHLLNCRKPRLDLPWGSRSSGNDIEQSTRGVLERDGVKFEAPGESYQARTSAPNRV